MKSHSVNTDLKGRVLNYLNFMWKMERKNVEKEQFLFEQLPENLKKELLFEVNWKILSRFSLLKNNFSQEFIDKLSLSLKSIQYSPNEIIYCVLLIYYD